MTVGNKPTASCVYLTHTDHRYIGLEFFFSFCYSLILPVFICLVFSGFSVTLDNLSRWCECRAYDVMVDNALFVHLDWVGIARCASLQQLHTSLYLWPYSTDNTHFSLMLLPHFFLKSLLLFLLSHSTWPEEAEAVRQPFTWKLLKESNLRLKLYMRINPLSMKRARRTWPINGRLSGTERWIISVVQCNVTGLRWVCSKFTKASVSPHLVSSDTLE